MFNRIKKAYSGTKMARLSELEKYYSSCATRRHSKYECTCDEREAARKGMRL